MRWAAILAGGQGLRLRPLTRGCSCVIARACAGSASFFSAPWPTARKQTTDGSRPETLLPATHGPGVFAVRRFWEKPDPALATPGLDSGDFSRDVVVRHPEHFGVVPLARSGWTDLGRPRRVRALRWGWSVIATVVAAASVVEAVPDHGPAFDTIALRGRPQILRLYGERGGTEPPVLVSSGDGGWIHLGPYVAALLSARGFFVVGFDSKAYLESFTSERTTLSSAAEPGDYRALIEFTARGSAIRPLLIGVSEGAGLSVLAATDRQNKDAIGGVIGLGLPDLNELGWRWRDSIIYFTHGLPNEPTFSTAAIVHGVAPVPIAAVHSTADQFVPVSEVERVIQAAGEPKRLWIVQAGDHRFSGNLPEFNRDLLEAIEWTKHQIR